MPSADIIDNSTFRLGRVRRSLLAIGTLALAVVVLAGCNNTNVPTGGGAGGGSGNSVSGNTIPVGAYLSLTGDEADFGKTTLEGAELAVDQINAAGGIGGKMIDLKHENDESEAAKAASAVTKLITSDKVVAVIGEIASGRSLAAAPICQDNKIPMVSPSSTNVKVTQVGDYIFRVCFVDSFQAYALAKFATDTLKAKNGAMFIDSSSAYSKDFAAEFKKSFTAMGGTIVQEAAYAPTDVDFKGQLTKLKTANADIILVPGYYKSAGTISKQAKELGITARLLGVDGWDSQDLFVTAGASLEGAYLSDHMDIHSSKPEVKAMVDAYVKKYPGRKPGALTALGYDSMMVLAEAMRHAKTLDGPGIRDALAAVKDFKGVTGTFSIDGDRNAQKPAVILQVKGNEFQYVTTIEQPTK